MRATSHARLTVDGVGTKSRDLVQERDSDAEKETGRFIVFREKILWKQICNENTSKCERLKNIEENRNERRGDYEENSKRFPIHFNRESKETHYNK